MLKGVCPHPEGAVIKAFLSKKAYRLYSFAFQSLIKTIKRIKFLRMYNYMRCFFYVLASLLFCISTYASNYEVIVASESVSTYDLSGRDGYNGRDGQNAYALDCSDGLRRNGRDGEDGDDGEKGENGLDAYIFYSDIENLKNLTLLQQGGKGGKPGKPGQGTAGCNGGAFGLTGSIGNVGDAGDFGEVYLIHNLDQFEAEKPVEILSLENFGLAPITLTKHKWNKFENPASLFSKESKLANHYFRYDETIQYEVNVVWKARTPLAAFNDTRLAVSLTKKGLDLTVYSGAVLDYRVVKKQNHYTVEVLSVIAASELQNLRLGKIRSSGEDLLLEVKESYRPQVKIDTRFVLSIYEVKSQGRGSKDKFIGQYAISKDLVIQEDGTFFLLIGNLNFPHEYKKKGTKLRLQLSVYREAIRQTRVFGLKGLFRI